MLRRFTQRFTRGFTLLELMIVVVVIAILASFAMYNYGRYAFRARRTDGREMLMRVAAAQERFFTNFNRYSGSLTDSAADGGLAFANTESDNKNYAITIALGNGNATYTLTATPQNAQAADVCQNLTITDTGVKGQSGSPTANGNCW